MKGRPGWPPFVVSGWPPRGPCAISRGTPLAEQPMRSSITVPAMLALVGACASLAEPSLPGGGTDTPDVPPASVSGRVLSKELGVMEGVHVELSPVDQSAVSGADGQWRIDGLIPQLVTLRLSGLPPG